VREVAGSYQAILIYLVTRVFRTHKEVTLLLAALSLAPVLLLSIRWRATPDHAGVRRLDLVSLIFYTAHAFLLVLCVAVAFDPPFSPRLLSQRLQSPLPLPFLPLYYLGTLSIGYYSGFFLLIFSRYPGTRRRLPLALHWTAPKVVYALLGLTLAGLLWKNLPTIRVTNGRQLEQYAGFLVDSLPPEGAVVCSHDSNRLALLRAALTQAGKDGRYLPLDANALGSDSYRAWLRKRYPNRWTEPEVAAKSSPEVVSMDWLARSNRVCYLQPTFGPLIELFYLQPRGLVYELKRYPVKAFDGPPLSGAELAENEAFWERASKTAVAPLAESISEAEQAPPGLARRFMQRAHINRPVPDSLRVLAHWYATALNCWGVALQRNERWKEATSCFAKATELNPDSLPAQVNLQCNANRLAGREITLAHKSFEELAGKYRNLSQVLIADGPFEDPDYCYALGQGFLQPKPPLLRQAGQQFERAQALAPKEIYPRLSLGDLLISCGMPDRALQLVAETRADLSRQPHGTNEEVDLAFLEAKSWFVKTNQAKAERILLSLLDTHPGDLILMDRAKGLFAAAASYTNALRITDQQLLREPDNLQLLQDKGVLCLQAAQFSNAIPVFTRILSGTNSYASRMYRAGAYLQTGQWEAATSDYKEALQVHPSFPEPYYRLADVAFHRGDTNQAVQYFQQGVSNALRLADEQLQHTPDNLQVLLEKAQLYGQAGQISNAIPVLTHLLSLTNSYAVRIYRAQAYQRTSQWEAAVADYREALRAFPSSYDPYYGLAEVAFRRGNTNAANQFYQQGVSNALLVTDERLRLTPDNPQALQDQGLLYMQAGQFSNAIPAFTRLLSVTNTYAGRIRRAQAYLEAHQWNEAQSDYEETLRLFPTAYQPYAGLGDVALRRGQTNVAIQRFNQYLSKAPTNQAEFRTVAARLKSLQPNVP
jgi:tetratricopeptide (TPR) repeat protein